MNEIKTIMEGGSEERRQSRKEKPQKIIIAILWEIREDIAFMKQGFEIKYNNRN